MPSKKFVVIEGGDCCGKTSFMRYLQETHGKRFVYTNEPGGNSYGMKIRRLLLYDEDAEKSDNLTKFHLYWASKAENFRQVILPRLNEGMVVVSDRFEASTFAYQISEDPRLENLFWKTREVCLQGVSPIYMHFDVNVETQIERAKARIGEQNYFDVRGMEYRRKVRSAYMRFFGDKRIKSYQIDSSLPKDQMIVHAHSVFNEIIDL